MATEPSSQNPVFKPGNTAVITGGASGIGLALALKCAWNGMNLVICDNHTENLGKAVSMVKGKAKGAVDGVEMDVSKVEEWEKVKDVVGGMGGMYSFCASWWYYILGLRD
jgi:short-subunit dehydrogenase